MSIFQIVVVCAAAFIIAVLVFSAAAIVRDERMLAEDKRRKRRSVIPDLTDYIDEHQSDDAPEFRSVNRDPLGNLKFRRY